MRHTSAAPGTQPPAVDVRLSADSAAPGGRVALTLVNRSEARHAFNACRRIIERSAGERWYVVDEPGRVCTADVTLLPPGATRAATVTMPASLPAGRYRILVPLTRQGPPSTGRIRVVSPAITVAPAPQPRGRSAPDSSG